MRYVVIIPHGSITPLMYEYRRKLFASQVLGAWAFPLVAPLALVTRAYTKVELQNLGKLVRALCCTNNKTGCICTKKTGFCIDKDITIFGPVLEVPDLAQDSFPTDTVIKQFSPITLCAALSKGVSKMPPAPALSFRAASLANMIASPLDCGVSGFSYCWKIGENIWLPKDAEKNLKI